MFFILCEIFVYCTRMLKKLFYYIIFATEVEGITNQDIGNHSNYLRHAHKMFLAYILGK